MVFHLVPKLDEMRRWDKMGRLRRDWGDGLFFFKNIYIYIFFFAGHLALKPMGKMSGLLGLGRGPFDML